MTKAEELAIKLQDDLIDMDSPGDIVIHLMSALHEYGALVKKRDAELCREKAKKIETGKATLRMQHHSGAVIGMGMCADIIEQEKLP